MTAEAEFRQAIEQAGIPPPEDVIADGQIHRYPTNGRPSDKAGWYILFDDGFPAGKFGDWRTGLEQTWCAKHEQHLTEEERVQYRTRIEAAKKRRDEDEQRRHAEAAAEAKRIWDTAKPATDDHPYLQKKHVRPYGIRQHQGRLVVPVRDRDGNLSSLQFIDPNGVKEFLRDGAVRGCWFVIGEIAGSSVLCIAEGYATAAAIHKATGHAVVTGFNAGNLLLVAQILHEKYPDLTIAVCGDHDKSDVGQAKAKEAAAAVGGIAVIPKIQGDDWNDVHVRVGSDAVREAVAAVVQPTPCVLDELHAFLRRFVAYPSEHAHAAHTLWIAHAHSMDCWESTPRIAFLSPEPGSGKTRALEITETLVPRPVEAINTTPAYLFRKVSDSAGLPTILYDEIDTLFGPRAKEHEEIRGIINAGHRRGAMAGRCVVRGKSVSTEELPAFCAVALAGLGNLPDTILTRSVIIRMRRRAPTEQVEPYRRRIHAPEGNAIRDRLTTWSAQVRQRLNPYPSMPKGITDRNADVWEALLAVADVAGGEWPDRARVAAVALVADAMGGQPSLGVRLLSDLRAVFGDRDSMWTEELLISLLNLEESPWGDLKGKPLDSRKLSSLLKPYGVASKQVRIGEKNQRGYDKGDLLDAWSRYLPSPPIGSATAATDATEFFEEDDYAR